MKCPTAIETGLYKQLPRNSKDESIRFIERLENEEACKTNYWFPPEKSNHFTLTKPQTVRIAIVSNLQGLTTSSLIGH